ncbi:imidazolonepropionase [Acidocella aquatica]|uniref:Imidazolonepropionase n=1 Tax=Acidocella aquatica TaxID=1922313 RepID=A0ABQ6A5Z6_9PROT|nr:imidazolonepropionase [Acidocella aquatica]GLR67271.1 imidazolonepropionase [Acidocella aquatica]
MQADHIFTNARLATMDPALPGLGAVEHGVVAERAGRIIYAGPVRAFDAAKTTDCGGRWITPGLIDCHTHLVFAGNRAGEFAARLKGATYEDIARAGGGIASTVQATRAASDADLHAASLVRLNALIAEGVTTVEIKSGYGLSAESELKLLRVIAALGEVAGVDISSSFLGAHSLPPEFANNRAGYLDLLCDTLIPQIATQKLADSVDGFCEGIAFLPDEITRVFTAAAAHGLRVKLHADQLSNLHGAALAASFGALSADHLEYTDDAGAAAMAAAGTVAVLLPGAFYSLRETRMPPIAALRAHGVKIAVSTDLNPGTSPLNSLLLAMNMAATQFRLTVEECLLGVTRNAAAALGRADVGTLKPGAKCHLAIWDIKDPAELVYNIGFNPLYRRIWSHA